VSPARTAILAAVGALTLGALTLLLLRALILAIWAPGRKRMSPRRKIAAAIWDPPRESLTHGTLDVEVTAALAYLAWVQRERGEEVTFMHLLGRMVGEALHQTPSLNGRLLLDAFAPHQTVDVSFLVALDNGRDLGQAKVSRINEKTVDVIAREVREQTSRLRSDPDGQRRDSQWLVRLLPIWALRRLIRLGGWLSSGLGLELKAAGLERFTFGACMISNVGSLGVQSAYLPMTPFARVPMMIALGVIEDRPSVVDGELAVRKRVRIVASGDHRYADGVQFARLNTVIGELLANPWRLEGLDGPPQDA
jgi:pyruvate dehydrogenase E2 component (dihydrolipoamide acetyltransferase)